MKVCILLLCAVPTVLSQTRGINFEPRSSLVAPERPFNFGPTKDAPLKTDSRHNIDLGDGGKIAVFRRSRRETGFSFNTPEGVSRSERQDTYVDPRVRDGHPLNRITGIVSFTTPEGVPVSYRYIADGAGYRILPSTSQ